MHTVSFGNAFSLRYKAAASAKGGNHGLNEAQQAGKQERVSDRFTRMAGEITGQETLRIRTPRGDYLLMDGPEGKTLSLYKELERGLGTGASPEENAQNSRIILDVMRENGSLPRKPKSITLKYGPNHVAEPGKIRQFFVEMGFPVKN